jgi:hypothetical protein
MADVPLLYEVALAMRTQSGGGVRSGRATDAAPTAQYRPDRDAVP